MIIERANTRRYLSIAALGISLAALPYSIKLCHASLIVFLILWATEGEWNQKYYIIRKSILLQILLFFAIIQLSGIAYSENISIGWFSIEKKIFFFLLPIALSTTIIKYKANEIRLLLYFFVASCFIATMICSAHALEQINLFLLGNTPTKAPDYLGSSDFYKLHPLSETPWLFFSYIGLAEGISIHPSYFSLYLSFSTIFLLHELLSQNIKSPFMKICLSGVALLFVIFIGCLSSRSMIISLAIILIFLFIYTAFFLRQRTMSVTLISLLIIICIVTYVNPVSNFRSFAEIKSSSLQIQTEHQYKTSVEIRGSLWWLGWRAYTESNPIFGAGTGDVEAMIKKTSEEYKVTNILNSYNPHNQYLYILIGTGLLGVLPFILYLVIPLLKAREQNDYLTMGFIFLFASLLFTETALELQKGIVFFSVIFSLLLFQRKSYQVDILSLKYFSARS